MHKMKMPSNKDIDAKYIKQLESTDSKLCGQKNKRVKMLELEGHEKFIEELDNLVSASVKLAMSDTKDKKYKDNIYKNKIAPAIGKISKNHGMNKLLCDELGFLEKDLRNTIKY